MLRRTLLVGLWACCILCACQTPDLTPTPTPEDPRDSIYYLPLVIHVIHEGTPEGTGPNLSRERILAQIDILNADFRRKPGTRGFNTHPDGADTRIEFVLARQTPEGLPFDGIHRIDTTGSGIPWLGYNINHFGQYGFWDPSEYINVWTTPLPEDLICIALGEATGPDAGLPGNDLLLLPQPGDAEGILINWAHFGLSDIDCHARFGRTLTHEMGHYLGLLHTWGDKECTYNDYCDDTPAVDRIVFGKLPQIGCAGDSVMLGNYMNYTNDDIMCIFTHDQSARMHHVLEEHPGRKALLTSPALDYP